MQINEGQVSISRLADLFSNAFMDVLNIESEQFTIKGEYLEIHIRLEAEKKFIVVYSGLPIPRLSFQQILLKVNELNTDKILIRFAAGQGNGNVFVMADYWLSYEKGFNAFHLVSMVKSFERVFVASIQESFL